MQPNNNTNNLGWLRISLLGATHCIQHIIMVSLPPIFPLVQSEFGLNYSQLGMLQSVSRVGGFLQLPAGILADRKGKKKVLVAGWILLSLSLFLSGITPSFVLLLIFVFLLGIGDSVFHPTTYAFISQGTSQEKRGQGMSIHAFGGWVGTAIAFGLIGWLGDFMGWRASRIILSALSVLFLMGLLFLFREPTTRKKEQLSDTKHKLFFLSNFNLSALIFCIAFTDSTAFQGLITFLPTFLTTTYELPVATAGVYSTIFSVGGALSLFLGGWLADKFNRVNMILMQCFVFAAMLSILSFIYLWDPSPTILIPILVFTGISRFFAQPAYTALLSSLSHEEDQSQLFGLNFTGASLGGVIGSILVGSLADFWGIRYAFLVLVAFLLIRAILVIMLRKQPFHSSDLHN